MAALGVILVVLFFIRDDWPALVLAAVAAFWSVILLYHARKTFQLADLITSYIAPGSGGRELEDEEGLGQLASLGEDSHEGASAKADGASDKSGRGELGQ